MNYLLHLTPSGIQIRGMAHPHSLRHPLFRRRWFTDEVIITCVRWYLRFKLSWVVCYVPEFEKCWQAYERLVGDSWRVDET